MANSLSRPRNWPWADFQTTSLAGSPKRPRPQALSITLQDLGISEIKGREEFQYTINWRSAILTTASPEFRKGRGRKMEDLYCIKALSKHYCASFNIYGEINDLVTT